MKKIITLLAGSSAVLLASCAINNSNVGYGGQPTGVVVSNYRTSGNIANPQVAPEKTGTSCTHGLFWVAAWGNGGTDAAMKAGDITKVSTVQYSNFSVLSGFYSEYCTIVAGK